jgi:alkylhydroperoxidase/carboxymuconolactone decarboxylase family protein YurZ
MVTIAILGALNHEELQLHLRAAQNTGVTKEEITEVLFHVAVYAGVPAANRAFGVAKTIYQEDTGK